MIFDKLCEIPGLDFNLAQQLLQFDNFISRPKIGQPQKLTKGQKIRQTLLTFQLVMQIPLQFDGLIFRPKTF